MEKDKLKIITLVVILLALFSFRLWQTTGCRQFRSFHLNPQLVTLKVEEDVGTDMGVDRNISRFFHNKYQTRFILATQSTSALMGARLLLDLLGPLGLVAFLVSIYSTVKTKNLLGVSHLLLLLISILTAILTVKAKQSFYLYSIALYSFSLWSTRTLAKLPVILILLLAVASFWYFSFSWQLESFCHDIFFN